MKYKLLALEIAAIVVSYIVLILPVTSATQVNVIFNGQTQATVEISPRSIVTENEVDILYDPLTGAKARVRVSGTGVEKIFIYKCGKSPITQCIHETPDQFDGYVNQEYAWDEISEQEGIYYYPQVANILILVKSVGLNNKITWSALWHHIERTAANQFNKFSGDGYELQTLDLHVSSADFVDAAQSFITNYQMVPFSWLTKAVFQGVSSRYEVSASAAEIDLVPPSLGAAHPSGNQVTSMLKDFYFEFPEATGQMIGNAITLNLNPSFTCGNSFCEPDLGETPDNCCYDCECDEGQYCDISDSDIGYSNFANGQCKDESAIIISSAAISSISVTDCSADHDTTVIATISNTPSSLLDTLDSIITIGERTFIPECTKQAGSYICPIALTPSDLDAPECGTGNYDIGGGSNSIELTLRYNDGIRYHGEGKKSLTVSKSFDDLDVDYTCGCRENYYCDIGQGIGTGTERCLPKDNIQMVLVPNTLTSYLHYNVAGSNFIELSLELLNAPGGYSSNTIAVTLTLGTLNFDDTVIPAPPEEPGIEPPPYLSTTASCNRDTSYTDRLVYDCTFQFSIENYDNSKAYIFRTNDLGSTITYLDGASYQTKELLLENFGDIYIPTQNCGNEVVDTGETAENCCADVGCGSFGPTYFCDPASSPQCIEENNITLMDIILDDYTLSDAEIPHEVKITGFIENKPSDLQLDQIRFSVDGNPMTGWTISCDEPTPTGYVRCTLVVPELDKDDLPVGIDYNSVTREINIGSNSLNLTVTFNDQYTNGRGIITKNLGASFGDITVDVIPHCGNDICEAELLENASVCCLDCGCEDDSAFGSDYFCDYDEELNPEGTCLAKGGIQFVIDSAAPLFFDTCERHNKIYIKGHVENEPYGMEVQGYWATLNGTGTKNIVCRSLELEGTTPPEHAINCTLIVPSIHTCSRGQTYTYQPNDLSVRISYNNRNRTQVMTLTDDFPIITATQSIRSLHDIIDDVTAQMRVQLDKAREIAEQALEFMQTCLEVMIVLALLSIVGMVASAWVWGAEGLAAASAGSSSIIHAWSAVCEIMERVYYMQMKVIDAENKIIGMEMCMEILQHQIDIGAYEGQEDNAYENMVKCIDFDDIINIMGSIMNDVEKIGDLMDDIGDDFKEVGEEIDKIKRLGTGDVHFECNSYEGNGEYCCGWRYDNDEWKQSTVKINQRKISCDEHANFALWKGESESNFYVDDDYSGTATGLFGKSQLGYTTGDIEYEIGFICRDKDKVETKHIENIKKSQPIHYCEGQSGVGCTAVNCGPVWEDLAEIEYPSEIDLTVSPDQGPYHFGDEIQFSYTNKSKIDQDENDWYFCGRSKGEYDGNEVVNYRFTVEDVGSDLSCKVELRTKGTNGKDTSASKILVFENRKPEVQEVTCQYDGSKLTRVTTEVSDDDIRYGEDEINAEIEVNNGGKEQMSCSETLSYTYSCRETYSMTADSYSIEITARDNLGETTPEQCDCAPPNIQCS